MILRVYILLSRADHDEILLGIGPSKEYVFPHVGETTFGVERAGPIAASHTPSHSVFMGRSAPRPSPAHQRLGTPRPCHPLRIEPP